MTDRKMTTLPDYPIEELPSVSGYSAENEKIRQSFITGGFQSETDPERKILLEQMMDLFFNAATNIAIKKSDDYDGGLWCFNEHGLLHIITSQETIEFDSYYRTHHLSLEEFCLTITIYAAGAILSSLVEESKDDNEIIISYFNYIYHLASCIRDDSPNTSTFRKDEVRMAVD